MVQEEKTGILTDEERLRKVYHNHILRTEDGFITELQYYMTFIKMKQGPPTWLETKLMFHELDKDEAGNITEDAWVNYCLGKPRGRNGWLEFQQLFRKADNESKFKVNQEQCHWIVSQLKDVGADYPPDVVNELFRDADTDKDGWISLNEFLEGFC